MTVSVLPITFALIAMAVIAVAQFPIKHTDEFKDFSMTAHSCDQISQNPSKLLKHGYEGSVKGNQMNQIINAITQKYPENKKARIIAIDFTNFLFEKYSNGITNKKTRQDWVDVAIQIINTYIKGSKETKDMQNDDGRKKVEELKEYLAKLKKSLQDLEAIPEELKGDRKSLERERDTVDQMFAECTEGPTEKECNAKACEYAKENFKKVAIDFDGIAKGSRASDLSLAKNLQANRDVFFSHFYHTVLPCFESSQSVMNDKEKALNELQDLMQQVAAYFTNSNEIITEGWRKNDGVTIETAHGGKEEVWREGAKKREYKCFRIYCRARMTAMDQRVCDFEKCHPYKGKHPSKEDKKKVEEAECRDMYKEQQEKFLRSVSFSSPGADYEYKGDIFLLFNKLILDAKNAANNMYT